MPVDELIKVLDGLELGAREQKIVGVALIEVKKRLAFLNDVGAGYLSLSRRADTLSGGESQRIRLASQIGSQLTGVLYVLDEPTIGLHPRDTNRLLDTLRAIRDIGNTVLVVEHDRDTMAAADPHTRARPRRGRARRRDDSERQRRGDNEGKLQHRALPARRRPTGRTFRTRIGANPRRS